MRLRLLLTVTLIYISLFCMSWQNDYYFKHFDIQSGLSQNSVLSIFQDSKGFMWFGTKNGLNRFDGYTFKVFRRDGSPQSLGNSSIYKIAEDSLNNLWVGTDKGIYIYNPLLETFSSFDNQTSNGFRAAGDIRSIEIDKNGLVWILSGIRLYIYDHKKNELITINEEISRIVQFSSIEEVCIDNDGMAWIGLANYGIIKYDPIKKRVEPFYNNKDINTSVIVDYKNNFLLVGTVNTGLFKLNKQNAIKEDIILDRNLTSLFVRDIEQISENEFWIGTENGIYILDNTQKDIVHLMHDQYDRFSISDNAVYSICKDRENGIWIGTFFGGVNYFPMQHSFFERFYPSLSHNSVSGNRIREFCEDSDGNLWIATEDAGLNFYNIRTKQFTHISEKPSSLFSISYHNIQCLNLVNQELWIGFFNKGIDVIDLKTNKRKHYEKSESPYSLNNNDIFAIYTDNTGQKWIGTSTGVLNYNKELDGFIKNETLGTYFISDILEDKNGYLWFATYNVGAIRYNPRTKEVKMFSYDANDPESISYDKITNIFQDSKRQLWFCSEDGGFCRYNEKTGKFMRITTNEGLPSNVVHKILEDDNGKLWVSTNNGLVCYDPESREIKTYNSSNGLLSKQFNYKSGIKDKNSRLYFGGINGFIAFDPAEFKKNGYLPTVVLTDFQIFNKRVKVGGKNSALKESISFVKRINLTYKESSFSIDFSSLSFTAPEMNKYAYKLEGVDKDWIYLDNNSRVSYSNITPGKYIFRVKAANTNGEWSDEETSVEIVVSPPFWQMPLAYLIYIMIIGAIVYWLVKINVVKARIRAKRKQEKLDQIQKEELYNAKIDFFTNIAHEIRTPLTLIKAPLDHIVDAPEKIEPDELKENLQVMEKNTNRLISLINQLLDFRETESKYFRLNFVRTNVSELIKDVYVRFETTAKQKNIKIKLELPNEPVYANIDREAMIKIHSNLFNNAIKYGNEDIDIILSLYPEKGYFQTRVTNDGNIIPVELREKVFEAFFQIKDNNRPNISGSGIGLALVQSLVHLHKGNIFIDSEQTDCSSFVLQIPLNIESSDSGDENEIKLIDGIEYDTTNATNKETILVVEDNEELQQFITGKLGKYYNVLKASNGVEAFGIIEKKIVNLIVSDVIMPQMDGFELCKNIKSNVDTSHIPVILLTAKTNLVSKIEGLRSGADAYIEKPFSLEHLLAQITNLLENRKKLHANFAHNPLIATHSIAQTKADEQFLKKLTNVVMKNIEEENFNIDDLAQEMNMSRTNLHRKIKGVSELTPGDFIRLVRLKRAAELLKEGEYRINEICVLVGFHSQSYFTKSFQKQFGVLPKDFVKGQKK